ncbi:aminoacyl-histidine dipeptidase [Clostridium botulinum]|uniref:Aminoacyl-histidine dipeptidase n=1 Tax=Clostridium botulinum TaxID=1491 RepID=A0A846J116_CLOBO|nr:aminoacyl-histidine dipeptidase [Clostridium botulinum]ACA53603.1 aminoacyl-histidine dipeptidase [Clostridium botulinum A3 str. Loch Maree]NFH66686.1 aminoacyl-histidine dipeptidase [Clostridium botulinum]NFJ07736.1 aminoacyl-histidine dipeptidase [Clostridium botulinum]NFK13474.1 aminoacyl-histidine dipeptidase [Clostridium botulinum]NFM93398.1 aminoacyl-histidine dipeptidase [Clostridium botulinum]
MLENLQPKSVFHFFEELTKIPHGSGDEKRISDYLVNFAKERNLEVIQDKSLNVIIRKPATKGYENAPTVIIQGHMDMVCEKIKESDHDFEKDPLKLRVDGDYLYATGTTLGGDDGIAVAYGLAVLDSKDIAHPSIEFVATTSEETGMYGAMGLDTSKLNGKILLNIDSEEEGIFLVSCSGGVNPIVSIPKEYEKATGQSVKIEIKGLNGGHSGMEIIKQRANANKLMGRVLYDLKNKVDFNLVEINGGSKHNAIALHANSVLTIDENKFNEVKEVCNKVEQALQNEFRVEDPNIKIIVEKLDSREKQLTKKVTDNIINFLVLVPYGVQTMSKDIPGLVESSLNIGIVENKEEEIKVTIAVRSSVSSLQLEVVNRIEALCSLIGAKCVREDEYPAWQFDPESKIKDLCVDIYTKLYEKPEVSAIHAGLECGLFKGTMKDTDMISFGPDLYDVHTPNEHLSISSVERIWRFLVELLKNIK